MENRDDAKRPFAKLFADVQKRLDALNRGPKVEFSPLVVWEPCQILLPDGRIITWDNLRGWHQSGRLTGMSWEVEVGSFQFGAE